ncbi:hypothetical protein Tco_1100899, partial [Tanacetum coccineum]
SVDPAFHNWELDGFVGIAAPSDTIVGHGLGRGKRARKPPR